MYWKPSCSNPRRAGTLISTVQAPTDSSPSSVNAKVSSFDAARGAKPPYRLRPSTAHIDAAVLKRRSTFERPTTPIGRSLSWGVNTRSTCRSRCVITLRDTGDGLWTPFPKSSHLQLSSWLSQLATSSISSGRSNGRSFIAVPIFLPALTALPAAPLTTQSSGHAASGPQDRRAWLPHLECCPCATTRTDTPQPRGTNLHHSTVPPRTALEHDCKRRSGPRCGDRPTGTRVSSGLPPCRGRTTP